MEQTHGEPSGGAADRVLTTEGLLVELHEVGEDVFRDGLLVRETLEQNDHLRLADGMHAFSRHIPALPVYICGLERAERCFIFIVDNIYCIFSMDLMVK